MRSECDADRIEMIGENTVASELMPSMEEMNEILLYFKAFEENLGYSVEIVFLS